MRPVAVVRNTDDGQRRVYVSCPGCHSIHGFIVAAQGGGPVWTWDENLTAPTFSPSMLVTWPGVDDKRCHSFLEHGRWRFLDDTTAHALRGEHPMVPVPQWLVDESA